MYLIFLKLGVSPNEHNGRIENSDLSFSLKNNNLKVLGHIFGHSLEAVESLYVFVDLALCIMHCIVERN